MMIMGTCVEHPICPRNHSEHFKSIVSFNPSILLCQYNYFRFANENTVQSDEATLNKAWLHSTHWNNINFYFWLLFSSVAATLVQGLLQTLGEAERAALPECHMDYRLWGSLPKLSEQQQSLPSSLAVLGSPKPVVLNMVDPNPEGLREADWNAWRPWQLSVWSEWLGMGGV